MRARLWTDGGSRGNPGLSAAGIVLDLEDGTLLEKGWFLGTHLTNNEAEYLALILGLQLAWGHGATDITSELDSKLVEMQVAGEWDCKSPNLVPLLHKVDKLLERFDTWEMWHIPRADNARADALANQAMDQVRPR